MKKRSLLMILALALSLTLAIGGTLAYLQDTDADVNVMTLGSVYIVQNEQERNEDGDLVEFRQNKPIYPAVYEGTSIPYADPADWVVPNDEAWKVVADNENVLDKFVTVTNTGKSDAYVRTYIAFEVGAEAANDPYMHMVVNGDPWEGKWLTDNGKEVVTEVDDNTYKVYQMTYKNVLPAGETTIPSLKQIYLDKTADNKVVEAYGEDFSIIALSQAVQANGFKSAADALDTAFPMGDDSAETLATWFGGAKSDISSPGKDWPNNNPPIIPEDATVVTNMDELKAAYAAKEDIIYVEEGTYDFGGNYTIPEGTTLFGMSNNVNFTGTLTNALKNVTVENVKFSGSDALRWAYPSGTVTFKNCEFTPSGVYAVHFDTTNGDVTFENCTINGWAAMGGGSGHLTFKNCKVNGDGWYGVLRCFADADVIGCTFDVDNVNKDDVYQDGLHAVGCTIEVKNCTNVNGTMQDLVNVSDGGVINIQ